jgi:predicted N-acetyltransferase YhbS
MVKLNLYPQNKLPDYLRWQIVSFQRVQWPDGFQDKLQFRDWVCRKEFHSVHFVLVANKLLISHAAVVWKNLERLGQTYKTYGLSGVFTYPSFRNQGYGLQVVKEGKNYIEKQDGDIVLFTSTHKGFYEKAGFIRLDKAKIFEGDPNNPKEVNEHIFMLFLTKKGKAAREQFASKPIYFGEDIW